jgi:hypothetical protein
MMREKEPLSALIAIIIAVASTGCFVFVVVIQRLESLQSEIAASNATPVDVSGWQTYQNDQYGFELEYPSGWEVSTDGLGSASPFVAFGNPLTGMKTYDVQVFIESNPSLLSSGEYAHAVLNAARAQDAVNSASGPAPQTAPRFDKLYMLTVGGYSAYEFYNVFEFDHNAEWIYVSHGSEALRFDFPVARENPNLSLPVINNGVAHQIVNTLIFTQ